MRTQWLVKVKLPLFTIDLVSYIIACFLAYKIRFGFASDLMLDDVQRLMAVLMGLIWIMIGLTEHGLKRYDEWEKLADLKDLFYKVALLFLTTVTVLFLFKIDASRLFISYVHAILFIVAFVNRRVGRRLIKRSLKNGLRAYLLFIGPADKVKKIAGVYVKKYKHFIKINGYLTYDEREKDDLVGIQRLGSTRQLRSTLRELVVDEVVIIPEAELTEREKQVIEICKTAGKKVTLVFDFLEELPPISQIQQIEGYYSLTFLPFKESLYQAALKRAFDIVFSSVVLLLISPVMLLIALAIKIDSPEGPVFFLQERVGLNGRRFKMIKFRTMVPNAEKLKERLKHLNEMDGPVFKITNDPRVTRVGRILRKTSLDELPQFINVLKGDMSVVGPRPPLPEEVNEYDPWHQKRLSIKPGITCIWQVSGRNDVSFEEWMRMDMEYIEKRSLLFDLKIIVKTIFAVFEMTGK